MTFLISLARIIVVFKKNNNKKCSDSDEIAGAMLKKRQFHSEL